MKWEDVKVGQKYQAKIIGKVYEVLVLEVEEKMIKVQKTCNHHTVRVWPKQMEPLDHPDHSQPEAEPEATVEAQPEAQPETQPEAVEAEQPEAQEAQSEVVGYTLGYEEVLAAAEAVEAQEAQPEKQPQPRPAGKMSALDAAALVLAEDQEPLNVKDLVERMADRGYWASPGGKTPHATLSAAIQREIKDKGPASRFYRADRGLFGRTAAGRQQAEPQPKAQPKAKRKPAFRVEGDGPEALKELFRI